MNINPNWRILTVGDGDLSFSLSLQRHYAPLQLTATVFDSETELLEKYNTDNLLQLKQAGVDVITEFDVTNKNTWQHIHAQYDVVIFQFPLIPGVKSKQEFEALKANYGDDFSINTLNRRLLRKFLTHSFTHFLAPKGARLACISSKDVKPYIEWNIESQLHVNLGIEFLGSEVFEIGDFPGYRIRNVDRDKHVKNTGARSYFWSDAPHSTLALTPFHLLDEPCCQVCRAGPFVTEQEKTAHDTSKKHARMMDYNRQWQQYLALEKQMK